MSVKKSFNALFAASWNIPERDIVHVQTKKNSAEYFFQFFHSVNSGSINKPSAWKYEGGGEEGGIFLS